jgi:hypothetical protein
MSIRIQTNLLRSTRHLTTSGKFPRDGEALPALKENHKTKFANCAR